MYMVTALRMVPSTPVPKSSAHTAVSVVFDRPLLMPEAGEGDRQRPRLVDRGEHAHAGQERQGLDQEHLARRQPVDDLARRRSSPMTLATAAAGKLAATSPAGQPRSPAMVVTWNMIAVPQKGSTPAAGRTAQT